MAKVHYVIEARKKAYIEKTAHSKKRIVIEEVVSVNENNQILLDYGKFISGSKNSTKLSIIDALTIITYLVKKSITLISVVSNMVSLPPPK